MVLGYHGKPAVKEELHRSLGAGRDGVSANAILTTARQYGLDGSGVRVDIDELPLLPPASILHWRHNHFVVFAGWDGKVVEVVDPAVGRLRLPIDEFSRAFTGVALTFHPADTVGVASPSRPKPWRVMLRRLLTQKGLLTRAFIISFALQFVGLATPLLTGVLVDRVIPHTDYNLLAVLLAGLVSMVAFSVLASLLRSQFLLQLRTRLDVVMTLEFLDHMVDLPYSFFQQRSTGDLLMRLRSNARIRELMTSVVMSAILDGFLVILYLALILTTSPSMGLLLMGLGLLRSVRICSLAEEPTS